MIKITREQRLIKYLRCKEVYLSEPRNKHYARTKGITCNEFRDVLGSGELRKVISNLRRNPMYNVYDVWEDGENKFGEPVRYKRYFVERKKSVDITK